MFVILEGCDGVGKSTLANQIKIALEDRDYTVDLLHRGVPERNVLDEYQHDVEDYRPGRGKAIIADRWHLGDLVYGELYRGFSYLGGAEGSGFRFVELFLKSRGAVTVIYDGDTDVLKHRLLARGEDYLKLEHIEHVLRHYRGLFPETTTGVLITDSPDPDSIIKHAEFWANQTAELAPFPTYIGSRTPRVLLVGEKRGNSATPSLCAFRPTRVANSSAYLLESLPASLWKEVGICNAYEEDDLPALLEVLAHPPVIALGRAASNRLTEFNIEHSGLPHPQFMRRFHAGSQIDYGQKITSFASYETTSKEFSWSR